MTEDEAQYAVEYDDMYTIQPIIGTMKALSVCHKGYRSDFENKSSKSIIIELLLQY
ncbi:MAG TPA: hypothetical protein PLS45_00430 [Bacillota bacterium]|nr:hypothetical protein [Bacillota bacterium]